MGTFHQDKSALHGITVVVDTKGPKVYVGRCDDEDSDHVILLDADVHEDGQNNRTKAQYIERASKFGVWKKLDHVAIPRAEVLSIKRLGEVVEDLRKAPPAPTPPPSVAPVAAAPAPVTDDATKQIVSLTVNAQDEVRRLILAEHKPGTGLRLRVVGGGCSGFSYKLEFDQKKEGDIVCTFGDVNVFLDRKSTVYLRGITVDHQKGLSGKGFVFHNPNATNTCGCGESFAV